MKERYDDSKESVLADEKKKNKKNKGAIIGLAIATGVLGLSTLGLGIGFGIADGKAMEYRNELTNIYNENFYNMLDSVNNLENKLSKTLNSNGVSYQRKTLLEASKNASEAEISVSQLPLSQAEIQEIVKFVNQISGYTSTLASKMVDGTELTKEEISTLDDIHKSILQLKNQLNEFERKMEKGYSIIDNIDIDVKNNDFSQLITLSKSNAIEYPTMIYDGPFSDSVTDSKVKGLKGEIVSKGKAQEIVEKQFKNTAEIKFEGETKGKFETYNFRIKNSDSEMLYIQISKVGGHILTISGAGKDGEATIDMDAAKDLAIKFAKENGVEDAQVVWSDQIKEDVYLNIAPSSNGIILYPDLVKVKIDLTNGMIVGYDATTYFTNHISRTLKRGILAESDARGKVPSNFEIVQSRLVLSPLEYNREVVCYEVEADYQNDTYYFYFNVENGELENVLKVIKTDNGNLLM